jgi:hypothetical protein
MATDPTQHSARGPSPGEGYEQKDASAKWIFGLVIFLLVSLLAIGGILIGYLNSLKRHPTPTDRWRPVARSPRPAQPLPTFPRLQVSPPLDLQTFRAREEAELHTYGWINQTAGVVRIPIERAMELVLQQGLPTRNSTNANQGGPSPYQLIQQRPEHRQPEIQGEQ